MAAAAPRHHIEIVRLVHKKGRGLVRETLPSYEIQEASPPIAVEGFGAIHAQFFDEKEALRTDGPSRVPYATKKHFCFLPTLLKGYMIREGFSWQLSDCTQSAFYIKANGRLGFRTAGVVDHLSSARGILRYNLHFIEEYEVDPKTGTISTHPSSMTFRGFGLDLISCLLKTKDEEQQSKPFKKLLDQTTGEDPAGLYYDVDAFRMLIITTSDIQFDTIDALHQRLLNIFEIFNLMLEKRKIETLEEAQSLYSAIKKLIAQLETKYRNSPQAKEFIALSPDWDIHYLKPLIDKITVKFLHKNWCLEGPTVVTPEVLAALLQSFGQLEGVKHNKNLLEELLKTLVIYWTHERSPQSPAFLMLYSHHIKTLCTAMDITVPSTDFLKMWYALLSEKDFDSTLSQLIDYQNKLIAYQKDKKKNPLSLPERHLACLLLQEHMKISPASRKEGQDIAKKYIKFRHSCMSSMEDENTLWFSQDLDIKFMRRYDEMLYPTQETATVFAKARESVSKVMRKHTVRFNLRTQAQEAPPIQGEEDGSSSEAEGDSAPSDDAGQAAAFQKRGPEDIANGPLR